MAETKPGTGLDLLWGAAAIAAELNLKSRRQAFHLLETGALPARKIGKQWVASREKLRQHIIGEAGEART